MNVFQGSNLSLSFNRAVVTVGTFDGVHKGHQALFGKMKELASKCNGDTLAITFDTHPRIVLNPHQDIRLLTTLEEKISLIRNSGINNVWILPFTRSFAGITAEKFVENYLVKQVGVSHFVAGYDHSFGKGGKSHFFELQKLAARFGFIIEKIDEVVVSGETAGSSAIRESLLIGNISKANAMLGYHYSLSGRIKKGNQIGKRIGFPTANLKLINRQKLIPANGVYACNIEWNGKIFQGMSNIGYRPTINSRQLTIEANIFDFDCDIYDNSIIIRFISRIRDEQKFDGLEQLKAQLKKDKEMVIKLLNES